MRQYQRQKRGAGKTVYRLLHVGKHFFFVLPVRYTKVLNNSQAEWFVTFSEGLESLMAVIARTGETPIHLTGSQYRIYLEQEVCERFNIATTRLQWGITFSAIDQSITALVELQWGPRKIRYGKTRKNHRSRQPNRVAIS